MAGESAEDVVPALPLEQVRTDIHDVFRIGNDEGFLRLLPVEQIARGESLNGRIFTGFTFFPGEKMIYPCLFFEEYVDIFALKKGIRFVFNKMNLF